MARPEYEFFIEKPQDPWPIVAADRARCPVEHNQALGVYQVSGWTELEAILKDWATFSSKGTVNSRQEEILAFVDPPRHDRQRRLFTAALSKRQIERQRDRIDEMANELVDAVAASERTTFDVVEEVANPLVLGMIVEIVGAPKADIPRFRGWTKAAERNSFTPNEEDEASLRVFRTYSQDLIDSRRSSADPPDDLITDLIEAEWDGDRLTDREICNTLEFLLVAANSTTTDAIGNLVWALESHPDQKARLLEDLPGRVEGAVEEVLRFDGPIHALQRTVTADTEVGGVEVPAGSMMLNIYGAASHDPAAYSAPDEFQIDRDWSVVPHHFGFGWGVHYCLGAHLARHEIRAAIMALYGRLPGLRIVEGFVPKQVPAPYLRGWREVLVTYEAAG